MTPSEKYTAAAYLVVFVGVLAYVLIIASKLQRLERQLGDVVEELREREPELLEHEHEHEPELERG
jgi:CcmD family protein